MLGEQQKNLILSYLYGAIRIDNGTIIPKDEFEKYVRKIDDLKLREFIPSNELEDFIRQYFIQKNCSEYSIKEYFRWILF